MVKMLLTSIFKKSQPVSQGQFRLYRAVFAIYLIAHFWELLPDAAEIFSHEGVIKRVENLPAFGKLPLFLFHHDSPMIVEGFIWSLIVASLFLGFGVMQRINAAWLLYGWISLFNRNPFISNPSLAYLGWILLSFILIPSPEKQKKNKSKNKNREQPWRFPLVIFHGYWAITALSYTVSGIHKLQCPSWWDGTAIEHVLRSVLARDNFLVHFILAQPPIILKLITWTSLFAEISFFFLGLFKHLRKIYWYFFLFFHIGIISTVNFTDLTFGMLVAHLYLYDGRWMAKSYEKIKKMIQKPEQELNLESISGIVTDEMPNSISWLNHAAFYGLVLALVSSYLNATTNLVARLSELTVDSLWGFGLIGGGLGLIMILERLFPDQKLVKTPGWWRWVLGINLFQLFAVILASYTWERWLYQASYLTQTTGFHLRDHVSPFFGGVIAYLINTWLFYWWHYLRHQIYPLWIIFHQFHHSPKRIEAITSFYKHPLEIIIDSQIMAVLLYSILGLSQESSIWLSIFSAFGEYFYHMNLKTPQWLGYFFQRPESHRLHHYRNSRLKSPNHADFPFWDMLNGTFINATERDIPTGFTNETQRVEMLCFKDMVRRVSIRRKHVIKQTLYYLLVFWGLFSSAGFLLQSPTAKLAMPLVSSPLPLVFSDYNSVETFSTTFEFEAVTDEGDRLWQPMDQEMYRRLGGSYQRRNVYGAMFSHGPFFDNPELIALRDEILHYAICQPGLVSHELIGADVKEIQILVRSKTRGREDESWSMMISCP